MAEFKLGRIKFVYQGNWLATTAYLVDDVVTVSGKTYICTKQHTAAASFVTDLSATPSKWNLIADGTKWRNTWTASTYYNVGDMTKWGGTVYVCKTSHTSSTFVSPTFHGLELNQANWDEFAANLEWSGQWAVNTRYKVNDLIYYGGVSYVCNYAHVSAALEASGLEANIGYWDTFNSGISFLGAWDGNSVRYKLNDVVKFGADLWICIEQHTSTGTTIDTSKFSIFVNGFEFEDSWSNSTIYQVGDIVTYGGYSYTCVLNHTGHVPSTSPTYWKTFTTGLNFVGDWDNSVDYRIGNVVRLGGYTYTATADSTSHTPPNVLYWSRLNSGIRWNSVSASYTNVAAVNVSSSGAAATFDVVANNTAYTVTLHTGSAGSNYAVNDIIKITGNLVGGISPANDIKITVTGVASGLISTFTSLGNAVTWVSGVTYLEGDTIYYGANSYICINAHIGTSGNNPAADTTATYWNILASGADSAVLTTQGDIVFYGATGAQRLPIGTTGQLLQVNNNIPSWSYYGILSNVVYVAPHGVDSIGLSQGLTIDKPWASVLFACRQIEEGYLNTNAGALLRINKAFIMKEVDNYVINTFTYAISSASSTGNVFTTVSTASMNAGMPIKFAGTTGGVVAGFTYYVKTVVNTTTFTISASYNGTVFGASEDSTPTTATFVYAPEKAERDAGTVIESIIFDLTHGGNYKTTVSTQAFFKTVTSFITTNTQRQIAQFIASLNYLQDVLLPAVIGNTAPAANYQSLNGIVSAFRAKQQINITYTAEANALTISQDLLGIVIGALSAGTYANIPQLDRPHTSIYVKTGTYNEFSPIVIPLDTSIQGDELRSTIIQAAPARALLVNDRPKTISAIKRIQSIVPGIVANIPVSNSTGNAEVQKYIGTPTYSSATQSIITNTATIQTVLTNGLTSLPGYGTTTITLTADTVTAPNTGTYTLATPTGYNTSTLTHTAYACTGNTPGNSAGYGDGVAQIVQNRAFIQTEIGGFLTNYTTGGFSWSALTSTQKGQAMRDVGYALDAVIYDMTYGGNTQSLKNGDSYYTLGVLQVSGANLTATVAVMTRLKDIIDNIIVANTAGWTKSSGYTASQVVSGTAGSAYAGVFAQARIQDIIDWINNGSANTTIQPCSTWVKSDVRLAYRNIQAKKASIQTSTMNWIANTYPTLNISPSLTYRDAGTIIDALSYDMLLSSTYYSMISARAYFRSNTSAQALVGGPELAATKHVINYISYLIAAQASTNTATQPSTGDLGSLFAVTEVVNNTSIVRNMLTNGLTQAPAFSMTTLPGYNTTWLAGYGDAITQIVNNYQFINDEIVSYLNVTLTSPTWSSYSTIFQAETSRDLSNILDALQYDLTYGVNDQSLIAARAYYSLNNPMITSNFLPGVLAALSRLSIIISQIIQKSAVSASAGNTTTQSVSGTAGSIQAAAFAQARIADIVYWINNGFQNETVAYATGTISGTTLTVSSVASGTLAIGQAVTGATLATTVTGTTATTNVVTLASTVGLNAGMAITFSTPYGYGTQAPFGGLTTTTYIINTIVGSTVTLYNFGTTTSPVLLTATGKMTAIAGVVPGTYITAGSGTTWTISTSQTVTTATTIVATTIITPAVSGAYALTSSERQTAFNAIQSRATEIQDDAQAWVVKFFHFKSPDLPLTNRDAEYIVTALSYDILLGSNFYSIINGRAYNRLITSIINLKAKFADSVYGVIEFIGYKTKQIAASGSIAQVQTTLDDMIANIQGRPKISAVFNGSINGTLLTVNSVVSGTISVGMQLSGTGIVSGTQIISGSGTDWLLNYSQHVSTLTTAANKVTTGTNYITLGSTAGVIPGLSITFTNDIGNVLAGTYYVAGVVNTTQITISQSFGGSVFPVTATVFGSSTVTVYGLYGGLGITTTITGTNEIIPVTAVTTSTNAITINTTTDVTVNMPVVFSSLPANITTTATTTTSSTNNITLSATVNSLGLAVGMPVYFTGLTFGTVVPTQVYYVHTATGSTIKLSNTLGGSVVSITSGSGTMTVTFNAAGGLVNGNQYWVNSIIDSTHITVTNSFNSGTNFAITNTVNSLTAGATIGVETLHGLNTKAVNGSLTYNNTLSTIQGVELLRVNIPFIANEAAAYVATVFGGTVTNTTETTNVITTTVAHQLSVGDPVMFKGTTFGGISANVTYFVLTVPSASTFTISAIQAGTGTQTPVLLTTVSGTCTVSYSYLFDRAVRDATLYVNALIHDLTWTGNYKTMRYAQVYMSAQSGATSTDMFHVRNGTGMRNMTLNGLSGSLGLPNAYGTRRPTAGAYVSLDPGFGPTDQNTWANVRSCYVQNVTNFGSGCVGLKIDGAIHGGGNRSILANDFTQVLSDGIGVWCTGSNALTECVSVFSYYGYAGYLAELGGRMRATNGNSSYGTYGVIAEGIDSYEAPGYSTLNNQSNDAWISNVVTDSYNQILRLEYANAGSAYTNATPLINGSGYNAIAIGDELRDSAVFESRLVDLADGVGAGGSAYITNSNTGQAGAVGQITIANTDTALSTAYTNMRIQLLGGTGVGQYANILKYNNGTKVALIYKPSFVPLTITQSSTTVFTVASTGTLYTNMPIYVSTNVSGLVPTTLYYVSATNFTATQFSVSTASGGGVATLTAVSATPAVMANSSILGTTLTVGTVSSGTVAVGHLVTGTGVVSNTYITANISGTGTGSTWTVSASQAVSTTTLTGTISVPVYAAGWNHVIPGYTINNVPDLTSAYIIEPQITYSIPGFTATASVLSTTATWGGIGYGAGHFVAVASGSANTSACIDGKTWAPGGALPSGATWANVVYGGGAGATANVVIGGLGGGGAVLTATIGTGTSAGQVVNVTIVTGGYNYLTPPTIAFIPVSGGVGATATCTVLNGTITSVTLEIQGGGYYAGATVAVYTNQISSVNALTWGSNYFANPTITIDPPVTATPWTSGAAALSGTYYSYADISSITHYYLATSNGTFSIGSLTGPAFTSGTGTNGTVNLTFVATLASVTATLTNNGVSGFNIVSPGFGYKFTPTITVVDAQSAFVAISSSSTASAYNLPTTLSSAWTSTASVLPASNLRGLAYGNNLFVAVGGTTTTPSAASLTGNPSVTPWIDRSSSITGSVTYAAVAYGNGKFVAVPASGNTTTTTSNAVSWAPGGNLPVSTTWASIAYGNGRFVALAANGTIAYSYNVGTLWTQSLSAGLPSTVTWTKVAYGQGLFFAIAAGTAICATSWDGVNWSINAMSVSSNWTAIAFGNPINETLGANPIWSAVSSTSGTIGASIKTGATPLGRVKINDNTVNEIRMIEPGSGFPRGNVISTTVTTNVITCDTTDNLVANQPIIFNGTSAGGITTDKYYYVVSGSITSTQFSVSLTAGSAAILLSTAAITGMTYFASPIVTVIDPNHVNTVPVAARIGNGALGNPSFSNRGTSNSTATASASGDGYADLYQPGTYINVSSLYQMPTPGSNVVFSTITGNNRWYKLVSVSNILGIPGNYTATFQISPELSTLESPKHGTLVTTNLEYSQVRLTGHDFLYIGTGNQTSTNYPNVDPTKATQTNQELSTGGGRVFFTSTDQDGNFNVGNLFGVQQSTGTATLNADAFNLSGLQSLTLGSVVLGIGSATITQFSTDPYFTANSDNIVPTQKAIKAFITSQIGGGSSSLNVNTITAGQIYISGNTITNINGTAINVTSKMNFTGGIDGAPVALMFFNQR